MRLFEFVCKKCKKHFEEFVTIEEERGTKKKKGKEFRGVVCPACKSTDVERVYSLFGTMGGEAGKSKGSSRCAVCSPSCRATSCPVG